MAQVRIARCSVSAGSDDVRYLYLAARRQQHE
jgi:hypothetical protein